MDKTPEQTIKEKERAERIKRENWIEVSGYMPLERARSLGALILGGETKNGLVYQHAIFPKGGPMRELTETDLKGE